VSIVEQVKQGNNFPFAFTRGEDHMGGWICEIRVQRFPESVAAITRQIPLTDNATRWSSELTPAETAGLALGPYIVVGVLINFIEDLQEQITDLRIVIQPGSEIIVDTDNLLLSGDAAPGSILLSGDAQTSGDDKIKISGTQ
jgi:hypothetical protein